MEFVVRPIIYTIKWKVQLWLLPDYHYLKIAFILEKTGRQLFWVKLNRTNQIEQSLLLFSHKCGTSCEETFTGLIYDIFCEN